MAIGRNKPVAFRFIDVGDAAPERKKKNESIARSHVMSEFRKAQREERERKKHLAKSKDNEGEFSREGTETITLAETESLSRYSKSIEKLLSNNNFMEPHCPGILWSLCLTENINAVAVTRKGFVEADLNVLNSYTGPLTPHLHELIDHVIRFLWGKYWPARSAGEASPLTNEWWPLFCNLPYVFHAFVFAAACHYDDLHVTTSLSQTREILAHKYEALRELSKALTDLNGAVPRDALILAMTYLGIGGEEAYNNRVDEKSPFNPPETVNSPAWRRHFAYPKDNVHLRAAKRLIDMKGGIYGRCLLVAKSNFLNDLQLAAVALRKPHFPNWDIPQLEWDVIDPFLNILPPSAPYTQGSGFKPLLQLGLTAELHNLLLDTSELSQRFEHYSAGTLQNSDLQALLSRKNALHHALLCCPTATEASIPENESAVYECCRLGALLYSSAVLYPIPPSTGTLHRLVALVKAPAQDFKLETCFEGGGKVLIWVLMLACIAAEGTLERPWFLRRLKPLLAMERVGKWEDLRKLLAEFLWMGSACDDGAIRAWEELERPPFL